MGGGGVRVQTGEFTDQDSTLANQCITYFTVIYCEFELIYQYDLVNYEQMRSFHVLSRYESTDNP